MSRHVLIAGTGRTGTSFLVRYLTALGMDTHLSRAGGEAFWDELANAGLEDLPMYDSPDLPYVIKSPWTYQVIHTILETGALQFDAVVLPMRDLIEAAASRSIVQFQNLHQGPPPMGILGQTLENFGHTPGGCVYSLNLIDQARLMAVGFHQLLEKLVKADIPVIFLGFPQLIENADYLFRKLAPVLPSSVTAEAARAAHAGIADPDMVRVGGEIERAGQGLVLEGPTQTQLERAALLRVLSGLRAELQVAKRELGEATAALARDDAERNAAREATAAATRERDAARAQLQAVAQELEHMRGSATTFLRQYLPRLRNHVFRARGRSG